MLSRRPVLALVAALALVPSAARGAMPVGIYPFRVPGLPTAQRSDLHGLLEAALASASRRGILAPRSPALLLASCGDSPAPACLGTAAGNGLVLAGRGELRGGVLLVTAALWDRNGNHTREVRFVVDLVIQNLRPVGEAIMEMEVEIEPDGTVAGSGKTPPAARDPRGPAPTVAAAPPPSPPAASPPPAAPPPAKEAPKAAAAAPAAAPATAPPKAAPAKATPVNVSAPAARSDVWKRQAGPLFTCLGAAAVVAGGVVAVQNRKLANDLDQKYASGGLTPADKSSYDKVQQNNVLSIALLAGGGIALGAGTYLWVTAPPAAGKPAVAMIGGQF